MKKLLVLTSALLVLTAAAASAQGINLAWRDCITQAAQAANETYLCGTSRKGISFKGVMSFVSPATLSAFEGVQAVIDIQNAGPTLVDFWKAGLGECRDGNFVFPAGLTGVGTGTVGACRNPYAGGATGGGFQWNSGFGGANRARIQLAMARSDAVALTAGQQYLAGVYTLDTVGDDGSCPGCEVPACLVLNQVELYQVAGTPPQDIYILNTAGTRQYTTWQGGSVDAPGCPAATPTHNRTWGGVKTLYR